MANCIISFCCNQVENSSVYCKKHGNINSYDMTTTSDMVNHPPHYNQGKFEVLDVIEDNLKEGFEAYLVGNILKYVMRYKHKNGIQDLEKAEFYLKKLIQKKGEENGNETK